MPSTDAAIRAAVESFVQRLQNLLQQAALESVQAALSRERPALRGRDGRIAMGNGAQPRTVGAKRTPQELEALSRKLHAHVSKAAGQRIEQIGSALGIPTKELVLPIKRLVREKKLSTKGQKRATTYWAK